jgi:hypothetical protein
MQITRPEAAAILDPAMTVTQIGTLIALAAIAPLGRARTGRAGRPPYLYDRRAITEAHAAEAERTSKQFADNDWIASALLGRSLISADPEAGTLHWPDGSRAETMSPNIYGVVKAGPEQVMAHRVIWIAAEGEIPPGVQINHRNRLRWDNRRANLELVTWMENIRHANGKPYLTHPQAAAELDAHIPMVRSVPLHAESLIRAGGAFRHGGH